MLKSIVNGAEHDIVSIPMKTRNLFDYSTIEVGSLSPETGNEVSDTSRRRSGFITVNSGTTYSVSREITSSGSYFWVIAYDDHNEIVTDATYSTYSGVLVEGNSKSDDHWTFMTTQTTKYIRWYVTANNSYENIMLNLGSTPLPYEPYGYQEGWEVRDNQDRILWGREDELQTATGTLPFKGYSLPLKVKSLLGNAVQNGTPAPDNIIIPEMCGVRTAQLIRPEMIFNKSSDPQAGSFPATDGGNRRTAFVYVSPNTSYTFSIGSQTTDRLAIAEFNSIVDPTTATTRNVIVADNIIYTTLASFSGSKTFTTGPSAKMVMVYYALNESITNPMLNLGSTALSYEPYGWKVPFENHGENLFNSAIVQDGYYGGNAQTYSTFTADTRYRAFQMQLKAGTYTLKISAEESIRLLRVNNDIDGVVNVQTDDTPYTFTLSQDANIYVSFRNQDTTDSFTNLNVMLNLGSTPKPYSPYLNETLPVYLGEVPTVRRIGKVVLTGSENWIVWNGNYFSNVIDKMTMDNSRLFCTHFVDNGTVGMRIVSGAAKLKVASVAVSDFATDLTSFKQYLASEYSAGHPVTVWYILATEQTSVVNEPLCKISTYADELTTIQVHGLSAPLYGIGNYKDVLNLSTGVVTRNVKKWVLTGNETGWQKNSISENNAYYRTVSDYYRYNGLCSHYATTASEKVESGIFFGKGINFLTALSDEIDTVDKWKSFLATQYANGTPVTVWYVISTPTTETVTVPTGMTGEIEGYLTQISTPNPTHQSIPKWNGKEETGGTYAVTVYNLPEIPTTTGQNTLTVDTDLAPSNLTVKGHIKPIQ